MSNLSDMHTINLKNNWTNVDTS